MKKYTLDMKKFLLQANWKHMDFGIVANFFSDKDWYVTEDMLSENAVDTSETK